ncbi:MAG TPA: phosphonate metabolism protein/1,5-bisphosphokinase (PRPP-forming) PhnN [Alphaproteobacteria bacterium]
MGPSGAGKDAVLHFAREAIGPDHRVAFAHRYITRPTDPGGENHVALSPAEFGTRRAAGLFAFDWQAHGISYGIGVEIEAWRKAGLVVVVSGSREHFRTLDPTALGIVPVLITAPASILRQRLMDRGRDSESSVAERLGRAEAHAIDDPAVTVIDNSGPLDQAGRRLVELLGRLAASAQT